MQAMLQAMGGGGFGIAAIVVWTLVAALLATAGGAAAGVKLAGKDLGVPLAAMMGAMYGPLAAAPAVLLGLIILRFI